VKSVGGILHGLNVYRGRLEIKTVRRPENTADSQRVCTEILKTRCTPLFWLNVWFTAVFLIVG